MIIIIIGYFKNLDKITHKIMQYGLILCFLLSIISSLILLTYTLANTSLDIFYIGLALFKLSCMLGVEFIICGLVMDTIKKQHI